MSSSRNNRLSDLSARLRAADLAGRGSTQLPGSGGLSSSATGGGGDFVPAGGGGDYPHLSSATGSIGSQPHLPSRAHHDLLSQGHRDAPHLAPVMGSVAEQPGSSNGTSESFVNVGVGVEGQLGISSRIATGTGTNPRSGFYGQGPASVGPGVSIPFGTPGGVAHGGGPFRGGNDFERLGGNEALGGGSMTNTNLSFSNVPDSVDLGNVEDLPTIDEEFNSGRRLMVFDMAQSSCNRMCGGVVKGTHICLKPNCRVAHKGGIKEPIFQGMIGIRRDSNHILCRPILGPNRVDERVVAQWQSESRSTQDWAALFNLVEEAFKSNKGSTLTLEAIEQFQTAREKVKAYQTPGKKRAHGDLGQEDEELVDFDHPKPNAVDPNDLQLPSKDSLKDPDQQLQKLFEVLHTVVTTVDANEHFSRKIAKTSKAAFSAQFQFNQKVELALEQVSQRIGEKPSINPDVDASCLWDSFAILAERVKEIKDDMEQSLLHNPGPMMESGMHHANMASFTQQLIDLRNDVSSAKEGVKRSDAQLEDIIKVFGDQILEIKHALADGAANLPGNMPQQQVGFGGHLQDSREATNQAFGDQLEDLRKDLKSLQQQQDPQSLKLDGRTWGNESDAFAFVMKTFSPGSVSGGLFVDPCTLFHLVWQQMKEPDTVGTLAQGQKIGLNTLYGVHVTSSFDHVIPPLFGDSSTATLVKVGQSYWNKIKTQKEWSDTTSGFKAVIEKTLLSVSHSISQNIQFFFGEAEFDEARAVCSYALNTSVQAIRDFILFVDTFYGKLAEASFPDAMAWYLTTRIGYSILRAWSQPRLGVNQSLTFNTSEESALARDKRVFLASVKCLMVAVDFKRQGYDKHPSIPVELCEFLVTNAGFSRIDNMERKITELQETIANTRSQTISADKGVTTLQTKYKSLEDQLKNHMKEYNKFVTEMKKKVS